MANQSAQVMVQKQAWLSNWGLLCSATVFSNLADGVFKLALPLLATHFTDSPSLVAGVAFAVRLPWLLFALVAGVLADRFDRRQMMIAANAIRVVALLGLAGMIFLEAASLMWLYVAAMVLGVAETLADTSASAIVPSMVEGKELEKANAQLVGITTVTNEFIGPPLGGALAAISMTLAFATSSIMYLAAAIAILLISGIYRPAIVSKQPVLTDIWEGIQFIWRHRLLRALIIIVAAMNIGWSAWGAIMVLYVVEPGPGGLSEVGFGIMLMGMGVGGVIGTFLAVPLVERFGRQWAIGLDILGTVVMLGVPALTSNPWAIGVAAIVGGTGGAIWSVIVSSLRQQAVPSELLGRTSGVFRLSGYGALPLGAAMAGFIAELTSIPTVFMLCALLSLAMMWPFYQDIVPSLRN